MKDQGLFENLGTHERGSSVGHLQVQTAKWRWQQLKWSPKFTWGAPSENTLRRLAWVHFFWEARSTGSCPVRTPYWGTCSRGRITCEVSDPDDPIGSFMPTLDSFVKSTHFITRQFSYEEHCFRRHDIDRALRIRISPYVVQIEPNTASQEDAIAPKMLHQFETHTSIAAVSETVRELVVRHMAPYCAVILQINSAASNSFSVGWVPGAIMVAAKTLR